MDQQTNKPNGQGAMRIIKACKCSLLGFKAAWQHEAAFRQELLMCAVLAPLALVVTSEPLQLAMLWSSLVFVLFAEVANSAIEAIVDRISLDHHQLSGRAKDLGSLMVMLAMMMMIIIWLAVIYQQYFRV